MFIDPARAGQGAGTMTSPHRTLVTRGLISTVAIACLCTWVVACASDASDGAQTTAAAKTTTSAAAPTPTQVDVDLVDYGFDAPSSVPAGVTTFTTHDSGKEQHELQIVKLNDGVTWADVEKTLHGPAPDAVAAMVTMMGGVAPVEVGGSASVTVDLPAGSYGMLCFIPAADGKSHMAHGMAKPLDVTAAKTGSAAAPTPKAKGDIVLDEMTVTLPEGFDGHGTWHIVNHGEQAHQAAIMQLAPGKTRKDLDAYLTSPTPPAGAPPATVIGGGGAIAKGGEEWIDLDLDPASYAFTCFVPDPQKGFLPHFMEGMLTEYQQT